MVVVSWSIHLKASEGPKEKMQWWRDIRPLKLKFF